MTFPRRPLVALALSSSLLLAACGGGDEPKADSPSATPTDGSSSAAPAPRLSPITGLPLSGSGPKHPVVAVKIDNSASSRPQLGLGSADMITEELVEGGITRLAVFFYTKVPDKVGPVRSMRATDIGIVKPLDATLVASGGAPQTVARVKAAGITTFTEGATGFYRDSGRFAPYNLFMRLSELTRTLPKAAVPDEYLPFGDTPLPRGKPASGLTAVFSGGSSTSFTFTPGSGGGTYKNTDTNAGGDDQFAPSTVLVLRVQVGDAGYLDPAGNPVPETKFTGSGPMTVFHGGRLVRGTWTKDGLDAPVRLSIGSGPVQLPPGKVWVELVPADGGSVRVTR